MLERTTIELLELEPVKNRVPILSGHILPKSQMVMGLRGLPGSDGKPGKQGSVGQQGLVGLPGADGKNGVNGLDGQQGPMGESGKSGKDGKGISAIKFGPGLAWVWIRWSDGSEQTIQSEKPAGTTDDPKWSLDGLNELYRVKDILAGEGITVEEDNYGNFTISLSKIASRRTLVNSSDAVSTDCLITIDASDNLVTYDLSPIETDGRQIDVYCIDSTFAVTLTGTVNGSDNPTMSQYDSFRMVYNASELSWELR